ncbi:ABC transporter ATP-binding protein [Brumimicrobium oceani]|uniref:Lipoprotein-releasing system ATP-binding protein LolD n=1 Tax=Brumimicrobium oceani TaxID=2100725 RepID=A0A2U2XH52_9FLAO|nr:ABC transporter ATP-binding protein [Brumimicrobium oceani]PWH87126.1 lipoprotein-releasing system ATP-binding protein LolD [Brumimicrobium oceani]
MIQAKNITKAYDQVKVLKGIDISVKEGELISIVGSSGAGKTTLLQILGTLERPDQGTYQVGEKFPFELSQKQLAQFRNESIGFVFQFHQLLPEFSALENAILPALIRGKQKQEAEKRAKELFSFLNLKNRDHHKPSALSGGEQQRVAVARALMNSPKVILADEPSGNLDTKNSEELHQLFFSLRENFGQTFIIVTHNTQLADISDRKLEMADGRFI